MPPRLPKNLKISFEKSPPPRPACEVAEPILSPEVESIPLDEPDADALDDVIDEMVPQFQEKAQVVESDIFAKQEPKPPPAIRVVAEEPPPTPRPKGKQAKLTKTGKVRKEMSEEQKQRARDNLKRARELRAQRVKAETPAPAPSPSPAPARSPAPLPTPYPSHGISKADMKQANLEAIQEYEAIRKARKQVKKEKQLVEQQRQDVIGVAQKASMSGWQSHAGAFHSCY